MPNSSRPLLDRSLWPAFFLLIATFALFELTNLDLRIQDHLYDFKKNAWLVDDKARLPRLLFYIGPKSLVFAFGFLVLGVCCTTKAWWRRVIGSRFQRRDLIIVLATLITAPSLIALGKATTNVYCPYEIHHYGGKFPYVKLCESYPANDHPAKRGRGFPAGHASGGFALMSLAGLGFSRRARWLGLSVGLGMGSAMGFYQMIKGAHYLSHTLISAILCWIVFIAWRRILRHRLPAG